MINLNFSKKELRTFGLIFTIILTIYFFYKIYFANIFLYWPILLAIFILFISLLFPNILAPFLKLWIIIGFTIGKVVSPLVLGLIFFVVVTPTSFFRKLYKQDPIDQNIYPNQKSYWKKKDSRDIELKDQF